MTCTRCNERPAARTLLFTFRLRIGDERAERQGMCDECTELAVAEYVELHATVPALVVDRAGAGDKDDVVMSATPQELPSRSQVAAAIVSYDMTGRQWYADPVLSKAKAVSIAAG